MAWHAIEQTHAFVPLPPGYPHAPRASTAPCLFPSWPLPLHCRDPSLGTAAARAQLRRIKAAAGFLLSVGADANVRMYTSLIGDPLVVAAAMVVEASGDWELLDLLLRHGADPQAPTNSGGRGGMWWGGAGRGC